MCVSRYIGLKTFYIYLYKRKHSEAHECDTTWRLQLHIRAFSEAGSMYSPGVMVKRNDFKVFDFERGLLWVVKNQGFGGLI